jgi:hypothetical protein
MGSDTYPMGSNTYSAPAQPMSDTELEAAIAASPSPRRVMREDILANIADTNYYGPFNTLTICVITMMNGFNVLGESACVDPANYREDIGRKIAYDNAFNKLWALEGYAMASRLLDEKDVTAEQPTTFLDRMRTEYAELSERLTKLHAFIDSDKYRTLPPLDRDLLVNQSSAMCSYIMYLDKRIARAERDAATPDDLATGGTK